MGWLFTCGSTRRDLIHERTEDWERTTEDGMVVTTTCLAHCYRGNSFSGVLWAVWERTFTRDETPIQPTKRFITCDLMRYQRDFGWGYKDMDESMHPYYYSCPLKYLGMVPLDRFGGNEEWRAQVAAHHQRRRARRRHVVER